MALLGRYFIEGHALHVTQRGNDRKAIFFNDGIRRCVARVVKRLGAKQTDPAAGVADPARLEVHPDHKRLQQAPERFQPSFE
jgi:REP element-mobilizing transposase RayT